MENVELAAREIGLGSGAILLTTELKITPHQLTAQNFSAGIEEYMSSHKLSEPLKLDFLNNLEKIAQLGFRELYREDVAQRDLVIRAIKEMIASQSKSPDSSPKMTAAPAPAITSSGAGVVVN
jgi:hypothetical protein